MNKGSIGEIPPRTRVMFEFADRMASPAEIAICANFVQSGSICGSQCDLLLGSFQIIAASIMSLAPLRIHSAAAIWSLAAPANIDFAFRVGRDHEAGAAQHGLYAGAVRNPPVGPVFRIFMLDEVQLGISNIVEMLRLPEVIILLQPRQLGAAP